MKAICAICPHHCNLEEEQTGLCRARMNRSGEVICKNYGKITSISLDPIEKKPFKRFFPGSKILSVGSFGCNFHCPFCQNYEISMSDSDSISSIDMTPEMLVQKAKELVPYGNIGIAYTYNEPLIGWEFVYDCAKLAAKNNLKNVLVTNGYICEQPLKDLLPFIDAMNIDLKSFTEEFYNMAGGGLETVKRSIEIAAENCHVELTTLVIPGLNDSEEEMVFLAEWIASLNPEIPLHITRFFPRWKMSDRSPTPIKTIRHLAEIARGYLKYVYEGNC